MSGLESEWIFNFLKDYAYQPYLVYLLVFGMMVASGFGFPLPEEVTIISVGLLTYMGANPDQFPPPEGAGRPIYGYEAALVTMACVVFADCLVFMIGRIFGRRLMGMKRFKSLFGDKVMGRINNFTSKYGEYAAFIFRFTPGIRFPAHIAMGMSNLPLWKFFAIDGFAALISVPSQILLIYHYGEEILKILQKFKMAILALAAIALLVWVLRKIWGRIMQPSS